MFFLCPAFFALMKKYLFILVFLSSIPGKGSTQQLLPMMEKPYTDSLLRVLQSRVSDSDRAVAGFLLSDYWRFKDTTKSKAYLVLGQQLAKESPYLEALYYFYEGQYYFNID